MKYITLKDLSLTVRKNIWKVPHDIDFVIGVPRSGLLPATMIAEFLNVPLIDLNSFVEGFLPDGGRRVKYNHKEKTGKVLVIDDTIFSGASLKKVKEKLNLLNDKYTFIYGVVYLEGYNNIEANFYLEDLRKYTNRFTQLVLYEWNIFHHDRNVMERCIYDIDGVFCIDPPDERRIKEYEEYIKKAIPLFTPTTKLGTIMTFRLEKYKEITEEWLKKNGIEYDRLIMFNSSSYDERSHTDSAFWKAEYYRKDVNSNLFIESEENQAEQIWKLSGKPVLCVSTNTLFGGEL